MINLRRKSQSIVDRGNGQNFKILFKNWLEFQNFVQKLVRISIFCSKIESLFDRKPCLGVSSIWKLFI